VKLSLADGLEKLFYGKRRNVYSMKVKILLIAAVVLLALTAAYAADATGKWVAETQGRNGPTQTTFTFKVDGAKLTGTMQGAQGDPIEITEGKVDGDNISFVVVRSMGGNEMKMTYKGKVAGDEIKMTREFQMPAGMGGPGGGPGGGAGGGMGGGRGGPTEIVAKRVK
jgi:hypothetical protein